MLSQVVAPIVPHLSSAKELVGSYFPTFDSSDAPPSSQSSDIDDSPILGSSTSTSSSTSSPCLNTLALPTPRCAPLTPSLVNPNNPPWPAYRGYHETSFAYATMGKRLPTILGNAIADTVKTLNGEWDEDHILDLTACVDRMNELMSDLSGNQKLRPIIDDGEADVPLWNKAIARYFRGKDFMSAPWVFAEAYKYRRLHECFSISRYWKSYDPFFRQKCDTFSRSSTAVFELSTRFASPIPSQISNPRTPEDFESQRLMFLELAQVCLWGNATDLSLLINMTEAQIKALQSTGGDHLASTEKNILANHLPALWSTISSPASKGGRIDFILDNAGFELFCDCLFADYLIQSGLASTIHFHGKRFAWFVSDVTRKDWDWLLNTMVYGQLFPDASESDMESLRLMGHRWKQYERSNKWTYSQHPFWCTGYSFWSLPTESPDLFQSLASSSLLIFKGDLNHRKLTYDCSAPPTTPFPLAIGPMADTPQAAPVCSMRTIKSDVVVGLPRGVAEELDRTEEGWRISGKYAVVLLSEGQPGEGMHYD